MLHMNQFWPLFRRETHAVQLALYDDADLKLIWNQIFSRRELPESNYDKAYSIVPVGAGGGRRENEDIPLGNMTMGWETYGAIAIEYTQGISLTKHLKIWARRFSARGGQSPESSFAGYLADAAAKSILQRSIETQDKFFANIFNFGGIPTGHLFFNQNNRVDGNPDVPATNFIYDGVPLFTFPDNPHLSYAARRGVAPDGAPTGIAGVASVCGTGTTYGATQTDTGGYFNAFTLPPSYWALKRVITHYKTNMAHDENDEKYHQNPTVLLASDFNAAQWLEVLNSRFVAYTAANTENIFMMKEGGWKLQVIFHPRLLRNTWFIGKNNSAGIYQTFPAREDDPWDYWKERRNRSYFMSYEKAWGMWIRNWRYWVGGSVSIDGVTPPEYGNPNNWEAAIV